MPRRARRWPLWVLGVFGALLVIVGAAGLFAGVGPLRALGITTQDVAAVAFRPTVNPNVIQIAVALPPQGLCRGEDLSVSALEQSNRIEVRAFATRSRLSSCDSTGVAGNRAWVDVALRFPLDERAVIRLPDRVPLNRDA